VTRPLLEAQAAAAVAARVAAAEGATGVEIVAAAVARSDSYPEIPWKAFALAVSLTSLGAVAAALLEPDWDASHAVARSAVLALAAGGTAALASVWVAPFARLFVPRQRREMETRQYAQAMFLETGLHRARAGNSLLLLASLFEREIVVFAGPAVIEKLERAALDSAIAAVAARLRKGDLATGLVEGLDRLERALAAAGFRPQPGQASEISDAVVQRERP
jgi:putative membrane protein